MGRFEYFPMPNLFRIACNKKNVIILLMYKNTQRCCGYPVNVLFRCRKHRRLETKKTFIVACDMACWIVSHPCSRLMSTTTIFFSIFPKTFLHLKRSAMKPWATIWRRWWPIAILGTENLQLWVKYIFGNNSSNMSTNQRILNCGWEKNIWKQEKFPGQQFKRVCVQ